MVPCIKNPVHTCSTELLNAQQKRPSKQSSKYTEQLNNLTHNKGEPGNAVEHKQSQRTKQQVAQANK